MHVTITVRHEDIDSWRRRFWRHCGTKAGWLRMKTGRARLQSCREKTHLRKALAS